MRGTGAGSQACAPLRPGLSDLSPLGLKADTTLCRSSVAGALRFAEASECGG